MQDKTVLVSGATAGIGRETAKELARLGAEVVLIGRDQAKSQETVASIRDQTGNPKVHYLLADLSSIADTLRVAEEFRQRYERLDVLVNNVGAIFMSRGESVDGIENTFALNHLVGYFLLTERLLDLIQATAPARIVNVSSAAHFGGRIDFEDIQGRERYSAFGAYSQSKLANVMFTYELARRLQGSGVTVNALHPGMVASNFGATNNGWLMRLGQKLFKFFAISLEKGAQTSIYLASSPDVAGVTGKYYDDQKPKASSERSYDHEAQRKLWELSEQILARHITSDPAPEVMAVPQGASELLPS